MALTLVEDSEKLKPHAYQAPAVAWPTVGLFLFFTLGISTNIYLVGTGESPWWLGTLLGVVFYNCGFTLWHEAAHGNVFRERKWNDHFGVVASFFNVFPAYYRQRHDHLLHHAHLLDIEFDRTVYRSRGPWWRYPLGILEEMKTYKPYKLAYGLKNTTKLRWDAGTYVAVIAAVWGLVFAGFGYAFLICCVLPRLIILPIHVCYVCYLPHVGLPQSQQRGTRTLNFGFLKYFIFFHNFHAVHHLWPNIPFYLYERFNKLNEPVMRQMGVQMGVKLSEAPIFGKSSWVTGELSPEAQVRNAIRAGAHAK